LGDAVGTLLTLQAEYAEWLTGRPGRLRGSATADALEAIVDLDLTSLARDYGRDQTHNQPTGRMRKKAAWAQ
jgi:hypothetical protein